MTFDRITFDSKIMGGRACIRGLRIPVSTIVSQIAHGATADEIGEDHDVIHLREEGLQRLPDDEIFTRLPRKAGRSSRSISISAKS